MSITFDIKTRAGSGSIELSAESGITSLPDTSGEAIEISSLEIDYDLEEDTEDVKNIFYAPSKLEVRFFDSLDNGDSLINLLDEYLSTDTLYLDFSFTTDAGHLFSSRYNFSTKNIEADRIKRDVTIEGHLSFGGDMTVTELFDTYSSDTDDLVTDQGSVRCMATKFFVEHALQELVPSSATVSVTNDTQIFGIDPYTDGQDSYVVLENQGSGKYEQEDNIARMLYRLATMDGAVMGSMLGHQYLSHRNSTNNATTITNDDVEKISKNIGLEDYSSVQVMFNNTRQVYSQGEDFGITRWGDWASKSAFKNAELNKDGDKTLSVYLHVLGVQPATWDTANGTFDDNGSNIITQVSGSMDTSEEPEKDDLRILVTDDPSLNAGDIVCFHETVYKPHMVRSSNAERVVLETPLQQDVDPSDDQNIYEFINAQNDFAEGCAEAYAKAYGANGQERFKLTILDIDSLDPQEPIYLDNSFRDEYADRTIQPSKLVYDIMKDRIEVEGYEIS